uniref:Uncharacterized protein n=1 Tax=Sphaerodactylus townsendi TaxID=933632 RepID=A0ACB8G542_9SAUR
MLQGGISRSRCRRWQASRRPAHPAPPCPRASVIRGHRTSYPPLCPLEQAEPEVSPGTSATASRDQPESSRHRPAPRRRLPASSRGRIRADPVPAFSAAGARPTRSLRQEIGHECGRQTGVFVARIFKRKGIIWNGGEKMADLPTRAKTWTR